MVSSNLDEGWQTRVLLIDDGSIFLRNVVTFLEQAPEVKVVGTVGGLEEALAQLRLLRAQVVISDLAKAGLPDLTYLAQLHASFPEIGVIILTLLDLEPYREAALAAGASEFVSRLSAGISLLPAIRRAAVTSGKKAFPPVDLSLGPFQKEATKKIENAPRPWLIPPAVVADSRESPVADEVSKRLGQK